MDWRSRNRPVCAVCACRARLSTNSACIASGFTARPLAAQARASQTHSGRLVLFAGLFLFIRYGVTYRIVSYPDLFAVVGAILTIYVFFIGLFGLRQNAVFNNDIFVQAYLNEEDIVTSNYKNSGLSDEKTDQIFVRLKLHMDEKKPFLKEDLSLAALAAELEITANQLSQVINQKTSSNFFNFINSYRVATVKEKFKDPALAAYSILGIAYDSGFRSKSSFNKIFKETTGQTPLQYRKAVG